MSAIPENLICFSGIAHPERFQASLTENSINCAPLKTFRDPHNYSKQDMLLLHEQAVAAGANGFLTTEKDMTKLQRFQPGLLPFYTPVLNIPQNDLLDTFILDRMTLSQLRSAPGST